MQNSSPPKGEDADKPGAAVSKCEKCLVGATVHTLAHSFLDFAVSRLKLFRELTIVAGQ